MGYARSETVAVARLQAGLTRPDGGREIMDSFARREIAGFVGYLGLAGMGERLASASAVEQHAYLHPYRRHVLEVLTAAAPLVQVLPGDGLFFAWPDQSEDNGVRPERLLGALLEDLAEAAARLGSAYKVELGLAYGTIYLHRLELRDEVAWTLSGTAVLLAEALSGLLETREADGLSVAFGMAPDEKNAPSFTGALMALGGRRLKPELLPEPARVGAVEAQAALLTPR